MTRQKKLCSNCGLAPVEKMRKLADQNVYCNDCREALIDCSAKELKSLGYPYYRNFQKQKNEQGRLRNQQRNQSQELNALRKEKNRLTSRLTSLQTALDKANQEIQNERQIHQDSLKALDKANQEIHNERQIHQDSLKIQDDWYRRLPPDNNNLKNILTDFAQKHLKLNLKNKLKKQRIKELESSLKLVKKLASLQIQELQEQLDELQQENIALRNDLEIIVKEKKRSSRRRSKGNSESPARNFAIARASSAQRIIYNK